MPQNEHRLVNTGLLSQWDRPRSRPPDADFVFAFAAFLVGGVTLGVPLMAIGLRELGVPVLVSLFGGLFVVGATYLWAAINQRELLPAVAIATVVFSTFAANLPFGGDPQAYPGALGPQLVIVQPALLLLIGLLVADGAYSSAKTSLTRIEMFLGGFVLWSVLAALFGAGPRPDVALWFAVYMITPLLGVGALYRCVQHRVLSAMDVFLVFVLAMVGHSAFATLQLVNQGPFGLSYLGEIARSGVFSTMAVPFFGSFGTGVFVSGFTGGNGPFSVLIVLAIPLALATVFSRRLATEVRVGAGIVMLAMTFVLRTTDKDAARGALIIAALVMVGLYINYWYLEVSPYQKRQYFQRVITATVATIASILVLLLPSSTAKALSPGVVANEIHIPFFNLNTLGIRMQQYITGLHLGLTHPLFGIGGANWPYVAPKYGLPGTLHGGAPFPLHNQYIAILAETGIPGFVLYVGGIVLVLRAAVSVARSRQYDALSVGIIGGFTAYLFAIFWVVNVRYTMVLPFWLLGGAIVASAHETSTGGRRSHALD